MHTSVDDAARMKVCQSLGALRSHFTRDAFGQLTPDRFVLHQSDTGSKSFRDYAAMAAVLALDLEFVEHLQNEQTPRVVLEPVTRGGAQQPQDWDLRATLRGIGPEKLQGDEPVLLLVPGEPDGRVGAVTKLVDDAITPIADLVADVDGVIPTFFVLLQAFDIVAHPLVRTLWNHKAGLLRGGHRDKMEEVRFEQWIDGLNSQRGQRLTAGKGGDT